MIDEVRAALAGAGDPERAVQQRAYMKSAMPYRGITSPAQGPAAAAARGVRAG